jgi:hypothetical protein
MKIPKNIKLGFQAFASSFFLLALFVGKIGPGAYIIGFMVGRFFGLRSGLEGLPCILFSSLLASLIIWIPFVLATSGLGIILGPAFAAYALFVWMGLCSGNCASNKE